MLLLPYVTVNIKGYTKNISKKYGQKLYHVMARFLLNAVI